MNLTGCGRYYNSLYNVSLFVLLVAVVTGNARVVEALLGAAYQSARWSCQIYHASCSHSGTLYNLTSAWPNDNFVLSIRVINPLTNQHDSCLAQNLMSNGIAPFAHVNNRAYLGLSNSQIRNDLAVFTEDGWQIPFYSNFSGQTQVTIYSSLLSVNMTDEVGFSVGVNVADTNCLVKSSQSLRANSCSPPSFALNPDLQVEPSAGSVSQLEFSHAPGLTSDAAIVINQDPFEVLYSPGDSSFSNPVFLRIPESVVKSTTSCGSKAKKAVVPVGNGILVSTGSRVLFFKFTSAASNSSVCTVLSACIDELFPPVVEMHTGSSLSTAVMAVSSTRIWQWNPAISDKFVSVDTASVLQRGLTIIYAFSDPVSSGQILALCRRTDGRTLVLHRVSDWDVIFEFPLTIQPVFASTPIVRRLILKDAVTSSSSIPVVISHLVPSRHPGRVLFAWGSVLLVSRTLGSSFYAMYTGENITSFDSAVDGAFAFITASNRLYYGHIDYWRIVEIKYPSLDKTASLSNVFFDGQNSLRLAFAANGSTADQVIVTDRLTSIVQASLKDNVLLDELKCPYKKLSFELDGNEVSPDNIDQPIFIDYGDQVAVKITADLNVNPKEFSLGISDDRLDYVNVSLVRTSKNFVSKTVVYELIIMDSGLYSGMSDSGVELRHTPIRLLPLNATAACSQVESIVDQSSGSGEIRSIFSYDINVYSGCPPGIAPVLNMQRVLMGNECIDDDDDPDSDALCFPFSEDFTLSFDIIDDISGGSSIYQGPITFTVLGAGLQPSSIVKFSQQEVLDYNYGSKSLWTFSNSDGTAILSTNSTISWQCPTGSPCSAILPNGLNAPNIYLLVHVSSITTASLMTSYCSNSMEMIFHLHGLPMDSLTMLAIAFSTSAAIFLLVVVVFAANIKSIQAVKPQCRPNETSQVNFRESMVTSNAKVTEL